MVETHIFEGHEIDIMPENDNTEGPWLFQIPSLAHTLAYANLLGVSYPRKSAALAHAIDFIRTQTK